MKNITIWRPDSPGTITLAPATRVRALRNGGVRSRRGVTGIRALKRTVITPKPTTVWSDV